MTPQTPHVLEQLSLYLDHALSAADQSAVKSHLNECAPCRRRSEQMIQLRQALKTTETLVPPESFYQGVLARIEAKASEKRSFSWAFSGKALVSACLVFIAVWVSRDAIFPPRPTSPLSNVALQRAPTAKNNSTFEDASPLLDRDEASEQQEKVSSSADSLASAPGAALAPKKVETFYEPQDTSGIIARRHSVVVEENETTSVDAKAVRAPETPAPSQVVESKKKGLFGEGISSMGARLNYRGRQKDQNAPMTERADEEPVHDEKRQLFKSIELSQKQSAPERHPDSAGAPISVGGSMSASAKEIRAASGKEWHGHNSAITSPREVVIRNQAEWQAFWNGHTHLIVDPMPPPPVVDFSRFMVVGVFLGNRGSSGYSAQIVSVQETGTECAVLYREIVPSADTVQATVMTQPFHLKVVPQCTLPLHFQKL